MSPDDPTLPLLKPKLLDQLRDEIRRRNLSLRTEKTDRHWNSRFILYHGKKHPKDTGEPEITAFLTHLARDLRCSALNDPRLQIKDVAHLLGFSEQSAFNRAFKRWTGVSPEQFAKTQTDSL